MTSKAYLAGRKDLIQNLEYVAGSLSLPIAPNKDWLTEYKDLVYDISDMTLDLPNEIIRLSAVGDKESHRYAYYLMDLANPFRWSRSLFNTGWRFDFEAKLFAPDSRLAFVYDRDFQLPSLDIKNIHLWIYRMESQYHFTENIVEAYKYGNGFPVLVENGIAHGIYNTMANLVLQGWIKAFKEKSNGDREPSGLLPGGEEQSTTGLQVPC